MAHSRKTFLKKKNGIWVRPEVHVSLLDSNYPLFLGSWRGYPRASCGLWGWVTPPALDNYSNVGLVCFTLSQALEGWLRNLEYTESVCETSLLQLRTPSLCRYIGKLKTTDLPKVTYLSRVLVFTVSFQHNSLFQVSSHTHTWNNSWLFRQCQPSTSGLIFSPPFVGTLDYRNFSPF